MEIAGRGAPATGASSKWRAAGKRRLLSLSVAGCMWGAGALLAAGGPAWAAYSGLTLIPTADLLGPGQACLDYQVFGSFPMGRVHAAYVNTQFGVGNRAELGLDFDLTEDAPAEASFNAKLLLRPLDRSPGVAVGIYNVAEHLRPSSYLAATQGAGAARLHAGAIRTPEDETQGLAGLDYSLSDRVQLCADYVAGDGNGSALGIAYQFSGRWGILIAWLRPNDREAEDSYTVDIGCVWPVQ